MCIRDSRNGATGDVQLKFKNTYAKFLNKDDFDKDDNPFSSGGYKVISSKMNEGDSNFYGAGDLKTPPNPFGGGGNNADVPF